MDQAAKGDAALSSGDFTQAVVHFTKAAMNNPKAVSYYIKRSKAYSRLSPPCHAAALADAETAVGLALQRGRRELIGEAQLRRAIALFGLERYGDAKKCLTWAKAFNEKEKSIPIWTMKIDNKEKTLDREDARLKLTVTETPDFTEPTGKEPEEAATSEMSDQETVPAKKSEIIEETTKAAEPLTHPHIETKIRHDWYQDTEWVTIELFARGIPKDKATVSINPLSIEISFPTASSADFCFSLDPLFAPIDAVASSVKIMSTKAEFRLKKAVQGKKWSSLEGVAGAELTGNNPTKQEDDMVRRAVLTEHSGSNAPSYPTSSKAGPKNWDKLANDLSKKKKKPGEEGENGKDGDDGIDDDTDGDPVNGFFKMLYKDADPDTRRAMMKSYQESNGTALSTNWAEVGKGPVATSPPDGMEARKW